MGKRDKRVAFVNPIAMARSKGPAPTSGPTIRDYLDRERPSLEQAQEMMVTAQKKRECGALAAWEEQMNDHYRKDLKKHRERALGEHSSSEGKKKRKKKKERKKRKRDAFESPPHTHRSPSRDEADGQKKSRKHRKRKHHHQMHSSDSSEESDCGDEYVSVGHKRRKEKHHLPAPDDHSAEIPAPPSSTASTNTVTDTQHPD